MKELLISQRFIDYLLEYYKPLKTYDFFGYIVPVDVKQHYLCAVSMNGSFVFMPSEPKYKLKERRAKRFIKKLMKAGFLEEDIVVFPEYDNRKNVPYKKEFLVSMPVFLFSTSDIKQ